MLLPWHNKALFWLALIFISYKFLGPVDHSGIAIPHLDKFLHCGVFYTMSFLLLRAYHCSHRRQLLLWGVYGALIEWLQGLTGYRSAELLDWLADMLGVLLLIASLPLLQICFRFKVPTDGN